MGSTARRPVFEVEGLEVRFRTGEGVARAVNGISFTVEPGERVAIVGESGCGKSASLLAALRLLPATSAQTTGRVLLDGKDLFALSRGELDEVLGRDVGMVFQDSLSSLNPVLKMGRQITEGVRKHEGMSKKAGRDYAVELLQRVGVPDPHRRVDQYPHQLSGGMRQRAMIAMALAGKPKLLIADEPTTALDVTVQAQILDLVRNLTDVAIVWVSHDLGVVAGLANRVLVMYAGYIIEEGDVRQVFHNPRHPYTRGLLKSVPSFRNPDRSPLAAIPGLPPNLTDLPRGCPFYERCEVRETRCLSQLPPLAPVGGGQRAACWVTAAPAEVVA